MILALTLTFGGVSACGHYGSDDDFDQEVVMGIDFGHTNTVAGIWERDQVTIIPNDQNNRITPSYIAVTDDGQRLVGDAAKDQAATNRVNTIFDVKRLIGRSFNDKSVQHDMKLLPYKIINYDGKPYISITTNGETMLYSPEEITTMLFTKIKENAEARSYIGKPCKKAVITVPAYFTDAQQQAIKNAATNAGLSVMRIMNEPTAAAIAYGMDKKINYKNILVFNVGGRTHDVTILKINGDGSEVLGTSGDQYLGGNNFDDRIMEWAINMIKEKYGIDISSNHNDALLSKLRHQCQKAKHALSTVFQSKLEIDGVIDNNGKDFTEILRRQQFEELNMDLFKKIINSVLSVLKESGLKKSDISEIILVGGSTRIPKLQILLKELFNGKELNKQINPDEAIAYGATLQAAMLSGIIDEERRGGGCSLPPITYLSLGIETIGGIMTTMIKKFSIIPIKKSQLFTTSRDNQSSLFIKIYSGERVLTKYNRLLSTIEFDNISPAPAGSPQIEIIFDIDINEYFHITVIDKNNPDNQKKIIITPDKMILSQVDIERIINEAELFTEQDKKELENIRINMRNNNNYYDIKENDIDKLLVIGEKN